MWFFNVTFGTTDKPYLVRPFLTRESEKKNAPNAVLPSEREVSLMMRVRHKSGPFKFASRDARRETDRFVSDVSNAFTAWGQYIIHDILQTPDVHNDPEHPDHFKKCECRPKDKQDDEFLDFCKQIDFPEFRKGSDKDLNSVKCIFITRSQRVADTGSIEQETANNFKIYR